MMKNEECNQTDLLNDRIDALRKDLCEYISNLIPVGGNAVAPKAYRALLTEKLGRSPEQTIDDICENLQFIVNSSTIYDDLAEYAYMQGILTSSSGNDLSESARGELIKLQQDISDRLLKHGISPNWLMRHGLVLRQQNAAKQTVEQVNISYKKIKEGIRIDSVNASGVIVLPDVIDELPVVRIGANAFAKKQDITSVVLPQYLLEIEKDAFSFSSITSITIPDSVEQIGEKAFYSCKKLGEVRLSQNLKHLKSSSFRKCESLKTIAIPTKVTYIGDCAFAECKQLKTIQIPCSVSRLGYGIIPEKTLVYCEAGSRAYRYVEEHYRIKQKPFDLYEGDMDLAEENQGIF